MITLSEQGLYCEAGGFHIDPMRKVAVALITHAHSDHARSGHGQYFCVPTCVELLRMRIGSKAKITAIPFGKRVQFGATTVSFHPAGHILGSAQIRVESGGEVWVASGDYKRDADPSCEAFESVKCDTFITEATFGQPGYQWTDPAQVVADIHQWWEDNRRAGRNSLLYCYALGKSQRVLAGLLGHTDRPVYVFGETAEMTDAYRASGIAMVPTIKLCAREHAAKKFEGELIIAPHAFSATPWVARLGDHEDAFASGWMRSSGGWGRGRYDRGFPLSDHADWPALIRTIEETGARQVLVLHGKDGALIRQLRRRGLDAALFTRDTQARGSRSFQYSLFRSPSAS